MRILMVRPRPSAETIGLQHLMLVEPLELEILYTLKRESDTAIVVDMILENKPFEWFLRKHTPEVLCITGYITNVNTILSYCIMAKQYASSITTIIGGVHCEVCPEDFEHESIDFRVVRNAAQVFTNLLNHIDAKAELPKGVFKKGDSFKTIHLPAYDFRIPFANRGSVAKYRSRYFYIFQNKVALLKTSFGCPYNCSFCFCRIITGGQYHRRPLLEIITELQQIKEDEIYIVDDDFLFDSKWLEEFIQEIKINKIHKHFLVYGRADFIALHPLTMHQLAEVGLSTVIVGFESFSNTELDRYHKNISTHLYQKTMQVLQAEKIKCFATIIIPPEWDKADFRNMVTTIKSLGLSFVNLQPLTPLPKTGLVVPDSQIIVDRNQYEKWDLAHITVQPTRLSVAEFYTEILKAYNAILFRPRVLWEYVTSYNPLMLIKMLVGSYKVTKQYKRKIKESRQHA